MLSLLTVGHTYYILIMWVIQVLMILQILEADNNEQLAELANSPQGGELLENCWKIVDVLQSCP